MNAFMMVKSEIEDCSNGWSEEYDSLPLRARLKLLLSRKQTSDSLFSKETVVFEQYKLTRSSLNGEENGFFSSEEENMLSGDTQMESFFDAKMVDSPCSQASDCSLSYPSSPSSSSLCVVSHGDGSYNGNCTTSSITSSELQCNDRSLVSDMAVSALEHPVVTYIPSKPNEYGDVPLVISSKILRSSNSVSTQSTKLEAEISVDFDGDLENIVLRERKKMLLSRLLVKSQKPYFKACSSEMPKLSSFSAEAFQQSVLTINEDNNGEKSITTENLKAENIDHDLYFASNASKSYITGAIIQYPAQSSDKLHCSKSVESTSDIKPYEIQVEVEPLLSSKCDDDEENHVNDNSTSGLIPAKTDRSANMSTSTEHKAVSVKIEPFLSDEEKTLKTESIASPEASEDELDHMSLFDRLMLLSTETLNSSKMSKNISCTNRNISAGCVVLGSVESVTVTRPRKRKRTATDSAETALEEDVPGLLKILIDMGVSVEDIKLYGEPESDDAIDESFCENSFSELEAVISKIFSYKESLLKGNPVCGSRETKVTYCLGCLFSLVEQARYLSSKKWPAEWGWSRDVRAFIFVFQKHNRIVMERPEYGFATYFFEMLDSVSVGWQVRRLVTAMKLTGGGRISLLENRALTVGEDLSEGEGRILSQYGWVPNTGLATMLNYCGRIVHDTNKEREGNEWKQKIGKMLVDGYNGGNLIPRFLLKKPHNDEAPPTPPVKLEMDNHWTML